MKYGKGMGYNVEFIVGIKMRVKGKYCFLIVLFFFVFEYDNGFREVN